MPHHETPESEYALLGAAMAGPDGLTALLSLDESELYGHGHRTVYRAIRGLAAGGDPVTPQTVATQLRLGGELEDLGGLPFLVNLVESYDSTGASRWHAGKIREVATLRKVAETAAIIAQQVREAPVDAEQVVAAAIERLHNTTGRDLGELAVTPDSMVEAMMQQAMLEAEGTSLTWGLRCLDERVKLLPGMLVYIAARPKVGKSSLLFQLLQRSTSPDLVGEHVRGALASYEMGQVETAQHLMAKTGYDLGITLQDAKYGPYEGAWQVANQRVARLDLATFFHNPDMLLLAAQLTALHRVRPFGIIGVDYVGKVAQSSAISRGALSDNFQMAVAMVSGHLKQLARQLGCVLVSAAQINRAGSDEPELHHLRDSGALEADADAVILLHPAKPDEAEGSRITTQDEVMVKVAANRMGPASDWMPLAYEGKYGLFRDPGPALAVVRG